MTNRCQAQYLRIFDESTTYTRWQSYYIGTTVTWQSNSWTYHPFNADGMIGGTSGSDVGVSIEVPATSTAVQVFTDALSNNRLCQLLIYEFNSSRQQTSPPSNQLLIGSYVGEVTGINGSFSLLQVQLGSSLAPVGAQTPPRKYTNYLVGAPIRL